MAYVTKELFVRNENCPIPVMKVKKALGDMLDGEVLHVIATDPSSVPDIKLLLETLGDSLLESDKKEDEYHFLIKKVCL